MKHDAPIQERAAFDRVRYASVWEDGDILCEALAPVARGARLLSVASAGDNALALLTLEPAEVVAADLSEAQLACLELRIAAFRALPWAERLEFLGVTPSARRRELYRAVREDLPARGRSFWDRDAAAIEGGVIHAGRFERYLRAFRRRVLPLVQSARSLREFPALGSLEAQRRFYDERWDTWRWRLLFRVFFSRAVMGRFGRDPEFFAHVEGPVGDRLLERTREALTGLPVRTNPWFQYTMTGNFTPEALPPYLRREHEDAIRAGLDRLRLVAGPVERVTGRFAGFNLSDIFEYMSDDAAHRVYADLLERATPGARLVYWNLLAPRRRPEALAGRVREREDLARDLHVRDRAWFYRWLRVDELAGTGSAAGAAGARA